MLLAYSFGFDSYFAFCRDFLLSPTRSPGSSLIIRLCFLPFFQFPGWLGSARGVPAFRRPAGLAGFRVPGSGFRVPGSAGGFGFPIPWFPRGFRFGFSVSNQYHTPSHLKFLIVQYFIAEDNGRIQR